MAAAGRRAPFGRSVTALSHLLLPFGPLGANTRCSRSGQAERLEVTGQHSKVRRRDLGEPHRDGTEDAPGARCPHPGWADGGASPCAARTAFSAGSGGVPRISQPRR